jgi:hypothetical protein
MTKDDIGDLFDQLAQRWGIDKTLVGEIVTTAQPAYPNCTTS